MRPNCASKRPNNKYYVNIDMPVIYKGLTRHAHAVSRTLSSKVSSFLEEIKCCFHMPQCYHIVKCCITFLMLKYFFGLICIPHRTQQVSNCLLVLMVYLTGAVCLKPYNNNDSQVMTSKVISANMARVNKAVIYAKNNFTFMET